MSDVNYSRRSFGLYSVESDLQDIFAAVMARYEQMKFKSLFYGESEQHLIRTCRGSLEEMRTIYREYLPHQTERMDFTNPITQWCYMYVYMLRHIHLVHHALKKGVQEKILQIKPRSAPLDVCMIGGGPGSDILGICLLMKEFKCRAPWTNQVFCLDACNQWELSWKKLYNYLPEIFKQGVPEVEYYSFNYREKNLSTGNLERIKGAKVVTMIKSLSSAAAWLLKNREERGNLSNPDSIGEDGIEWNSLYSIMNHMQPGAILLYIDNKTKSGCAREILMTAAKYLKMDVLLDVDLPEVQMPTSFLACNRKFSEQIDCQPCSSAGCNEMILLRKPGDRLYGVKLEVTVPNSSPSEYKFSPQSASVHEFSPQSATVHDFSYNRVNKTNAEYFTPFWENKTTEPQPPSPSKLKNTCT